MLLSAIQGSQVAAAKHVNNAPARAGRDRATRCHYTEFRNGCDGRPTQNGILFRSHENDEPAFPFPL